MLRSLSWSVAELFLATRSLAFPYEPQSLTIKFWVKKAPRLCQTPRLPISPERDPLHYERPLSTTQKLMKFTRIQHRFGNRCAMIANPVSVSSCLILAGSLQASHWAHQPPRTSRSVLRASLIFWLKCPNEIQICCYLKSHLSWRHTRNATRRTITIISF